MKKVFDANGNIKEKHGVTKLPDEVARLPASWVTKEEADGDKVHPDDPPHVADALLMDIARKEVFGSPVKLEDVVKELGKQKLGVHKITSQDQIDIVRMRIISTIIGSELQMLQRGGGLQFKTQHLWFKNDNINEYELKEGNAPADSQRPKHLRGYELYIDPLNWPRRIVDKLKEKGVDAPDKEEMICKLRNSSKSAIITPN